MVSWQTVALSVSAALITGTAAVLVAWMNIRSQRRQQLQTRRVEAASDFSKRFTGAGDAVGFALAHHDDPGARGNALHLVGELTPLLGPISLLYGEGSTVTHEATAAFEALREAAGAAESGDPDGAARAVAASREHRARFEDAARRVVG